MQFEYPQAMAARNPYHNGASRQKELFQFPMLTAHDADWRGAKAALNQADRVVWAKAEASGHAVL